MRAIMAIIVLAAALAGCMDGDGDGPTTVTQTTTVTTTPTTSTSSTTSTTTSTTTGPAPDCDDPYGPDPDCPVPGCQFHSVSMEFRYAAAGVSDPSWMLLDWQDTMRWTDLQREDGQHSHIIATGEGMFNTTSLPQRAQSLRDEPHAVLAWAAEPDHALAAEFCARLGSGASEESPETPWPIFMHTSDFVTIEYAGPDTALGQALCALWHQSWDDADVEITGGHHGAICGPPPN